MTSNLIRTILMVALISKLGTAVDAERMPSGVIPQNERENLPRVCHALAFLGMTRCQDLFLVHLQGWKLGTRH
nr:protein TMEM155 isoform X7 [Microcebus murinus]XP_012639675.1 protein TMEM155 isoform X7 [Microcebus murinus]